MTKKDRAKAAVDLLRQAYPDATCALQYTHDYELLFATRLSAQCTDARVNIVTKDLFVRFPTLESFAEAPVEDIEEGLADGLVMNRIGSSILRFLPPLVITCEEVDEACDRLERILDRLA